MELIICIMHLVMFHVLQGDSIIRYYEITDEAPYVHYLSLYQSRDPTRGFGVMCKRGLNINNCEIMRYCVWGIFLSWNILYEWCYRIHGDMFIKNISLSWCKRFILTIWCLKLDGSFSAKSFIKK